MEIQTKALPERAYKHPLYPIWANMIARCENQNNPEFQRYGARGITVCERWRQSFEVFQADMEPTHKVGLTLERLDNEIGYTPENCAWKTVREQARNRRSNKLITLYTETKTLVEWCEELNRDYNSVQLRLSRGWPEKQALMTKTVKPYRDIQALAKERKAKQHAKLSNFT